MRSSDVTAGNTIYASDVNKLRDDAYASSWLLAHEQTSPDLTLKVENGVYYLNGIRIDFAGGNSPSFTAPATNPRIDILSIDLTGTLVRTAGTEAVSPVAPTEPINSILIAQIYNRVGQTSIKDTDDSTNGYIYKDVRNFIQNQSSDFLKFTAGIDLTAGDTAGISADMDSTVAKAIYTSIQTQVATASGSFKRFEPDSLIWLTADKFVFGFYNNSTNVFAVVVGTVDIDTMEISFGSDVNVTTSEGYESAKLVKLSTDKFAVFFAEDGDNNLKITTYSVSGTAITSQHINSTGLGSGNMLRVTVIPMGTDEAVFFISGPTSSTRIIGYVTWSTYVSSVISTSSAFGSSIWSNGARLCKVDTNKVVMVSNTVTSNQRKIFCFTVGGSISMGTEFTTSLELQSSDTYLNVDIVSYATDRAFARTKADTGITYFVISISGTTCTMPVSLYSTSSTGETASTSGKMIYQASTGRVVEYVNATVASNSGLYSIIPSDSSIIRTIITNGINLTPVNNVIVMANNIDNDYYIIVGGVSSQRYGNAFIRGLSATFLGFVQSTVSRGDDVYIRRDGDNHQTGLIPGANYVPYQGGLIGNTDIKNNNSLFAKSATEILR